MTDDLKARGYALLAIGLAATALPVAAAISIARDLARKVLHYDQTGYWE